MQFTLFFFILLALTSLKYVNAAMTMKQLHQSMALFRQKCVEKTKASLALVEAIQRGEFSNEKELKCYTLCVAQMSGLLNKKNELVESKAVGQIETILPIELRPMARSALQACKDIQYQYKESCDRMYHMTICLYQNNPKEFLYP